MSEINSGVELNHTYGLIMAGGQGSRLTPYSDEVPKQFLPIDKDQTLIQETVERSKSLFDHCYISTTESLLENVAQQLPEISPENYIIEPNSRNTLAAIAYSCLFISIKDPEAIIAFIPSDHIIKNPLDFNQAITSALGIVNLSPEKVVFLGVIPQYPSTELGYIEAQKTNDSNVLSVKSFHEKPDSKTAQKYLHNKNYYWNTGDYFFKASTFLELIRLRLPETFQILEQIKPLLADQSSESKTKISELYSQIPHENIAKAGFEDPEFNQGVMIPIRTGWTDIGTWKSVYDYFVKNKSEYVKKPVRNFNLNNHNCLILNNTDKPVTTLGIRNTLIVNTPNGTIIVHRKELPNISVHLKKLSQNLTTDINNKNCQIDNSKNKPLLVIGLKNTIVRQTPEGLTVIRKSKLRKLEQTQSKRKTKS